MSAASFRFGPLSGGRDHRHRQAFGDRSFGGDSNRLESMTSGSLQVSYNDRSELTASNRYLGTDTSDVSQPVAPESRIYDYDPIGNRTMATEGTSDTTYTANELNQYDTITIGANLTIPDYDADGNLTAHDGGIYSRRQPPRRDHPKRSGRMYGGWI
jgi:hypothetical protein